MDFKQLDYFIKVCEAGSFTKAAKKNFISPQGINSAIIKLENKCGKELFIRRHDGVKLTYDGQYLYNQSMSILKIINECESYFQKQIIKKQPITISCVNELFNVLPSKASELIISSKLIKINTQGGSTACEKDVVNDNSIFALVSGPPFKSDLTYEFCFSKRRYLITNIENSLLHRKDLKMSDLKYCDFIMVNPTFKTNNEFKKVCNKHRFLPNIVFYTDSLATTYSMIKTNKNWIGMTLDFYWEQYKDPKIGILQIVDLNWNWDIYLVYKTEQKLNNLEVKFKTELLKCFSDNNVIINNKENL